MEFKRRLKLNGWVRIGIVASAVWLIWSYNAEFDHLQKVTGSLNVDLEQSCIMARERTGESFDQAFPHCDLVSDENLPKRYQETRDNRVEAMERAFLPIPIAWALAFVALFLSRWIKRGFQTKAIH